MSLADGGQKHCCYWQNNFDFCLVDCVAFILFFVVTFAFITLKKYFGEKKNHPKK